MELRDMTAKDIEIFLKKNVPSYFPFFEKGAGCAEDALERMVKNSVTYKEIMLATNFCDRKYGREHNFFRFVEEYIKLHPNIVTERRYKRLFRQTI